MVLKIIVIYAVLSYVGMFAHAKYSDCGSTDGKIVNAVIEDCEEENERYVLKGGTDATINIKFVSSVDSTNLTAGAKILIFGRQNRLNIPNNDGCKSSGIECPIKAEETYNYSTTIPVTSPFRKLFTEIEWTLENDDGKNIVCVKIPVIILKKED